MNLLPCCGRWVSGDCTEYLNFSDNLFIAASAGSFTLNVDYSAGFSRAWINCDSEISYSYTQEVLGILKLFSVNHDDASTIISSFNDQASTNKL